MKKNLSEMSLEELWQLFPIILVEPSENWSELFIEEEQFLRAILSSYEQINIHHIGSTAIRNIWAKPIIDILVEIPDDTDMQVIKNTLLQSGYICMSEQQAKMSFNKGYTNEGFADKVFHLHLRYEGDCNEIYFRDHLNANPEIAQCYEQLKLSLWKQYKHDRDGYTAAKTDFIMTHTKNAMNDYI